MPRVASFIVFAVVSLAVIGLVHAYLWLRLINATQIPSPWNGVATGALALLAISVPAGMIAGHLLQLESTALVRIAYVWLGLMFILLTLTVASDVLRLGWYAVQRILELTSGRIDPPLGLTAIRSIAGSVIVLALMLGSAAAIGPDDVPAVRNVEVELSKLPAALDKTTIVQLTDLHLGDTVGEPWFSKVVDRVLELRPDLVVITGDLVDGSVSSLAPAAAPLKRLHPPLGTYFVTGNHEYYSGVEEWVAELRRLGVHVLRNERVSVGNEAASFDLAGVDDSGTHHFDGNHGADLSRALEGRDTTRALVLLSHQPKTVDEAARNAVDLQLSGHTHGGQLWPFGYLVALTQPYLSGLALHNNTTRIYVSNGTGQWGPPMRLGAPAEITRIVLRSPAATH